MTAPADSQDAMSRILWYAFAAADHEALLGDRPERETPAGYTRRIVRAAVMHLVAQDLLTVPPGIGERLSKPVALDPGVWSAGAATGEYEGRETELRDEEGL